MSLGMGEIIHKDYKAYTIFFIRLIRRGCSSYEGLRSTGHFPRGFFVVLSPRYLTRGVSRACCERITSSPPDSYIYVWNL